MTNPNRLNRTSWRLVSILPSILSCIVALSQAGEQALAGDAARACRIVVIDEQSQWPVPLVQLTTTDDVRYVTDNAGVIALDDPTLMNQTIWFHVSGHGYEVAADGFGYCGVRLMPRPGQTLTVKVRRNSIAKRLGRLTGAGLFAESQKLNEQLDWQDGPVVGCDSVQNAVYQGKLFWAWGDTKLASYPLGVFHMTGATTTLQPFDSLEPPLRPRFNYFAEPQGRPRALAKIPGDGPTWLTGVVSLPAADGSEKLVACYRKIVGHLEVYEAGQCVWNDTTKQFEHLRTVWKKADDQPQPISMREGHPVFWTDQDGQRWVLFGNPLPHARVPASFEAWQDAAQWQALTPQRSLASADDGQPVVPHSGSIAWNAYRGRWVTVFMQKFGKPSAFGTLWYAEADSPTGPWGPAVEILSHDNYTFYNPRLHPECTADDSPVLLFEGTYTAEFADHAVPTPRYNYNQILYRLDLDDAELGGAK